MRKLITANFHRFSKDRFSWCVLGIVVILSLGNVFNSVGSFETMAASGYAVSLDEYYFNQAPLIGAFLALLISMFLGTEFSEGTIRNKLCIGHKRDEIFLSNFISCAFASIVLTVVWLLSSGLLFGLIGPLEMEVSKFIGCIFVAVGFAVSFAALYTVIGSLSSNKAMTIIYTFAVFIILVMAASALYDRLSEPEMHTGMTIVGNQFVEMEPTPNSAAKNALIEGLGLNHLFDRSHQLTPEEKRLWRLFDRVEVAEIMARDALAKGAYMVGAEDRERMLR